MRILFVLENYTPYIGGAEIAFKNLTERLVKEGHHVDIVTHRIPKTQLFEQINGVNVHRVRCLDSRYLFTFLSIPKIFKLAKDADVIHTTTFNAAPPAWLVGKLRSKPTILTLLEIWIGKWRSVTDFSPTKATIHNTLEKLIYKFRFTHYACISESTRRDAIKIGIAEEKTTVIYPGLDYEFWNPKKFDGARVREKNNLDGKFVCFSWGRIGPSKGFEYAIRSIAAAKEKIPNIMLLLMVSNPQTYTELYERLKQIIIEEKIEKNVLIVDSVPYDELGNYIAAADCIIIPSIAEGFGYTTVEACAMGKPIVATNVGSIPEVVSGKHVLVESKNPQAIADGIVKVFEKKTEETPLKRFDWDTNAEKYVRLYNKILAEDKRQ